MKRKYQALVYLFCFAILIAAGFLWYFRRGLLEEAYQDTLSPLADLVKDFFYPRFDAEKNRLPMEFFEEKISQILLRVLLVTLASIAITYFLSNSLRFRNRLGSFSEKSTSLDNVNALRVIFYCLLIVITRDVYQDLKALTPLREFYKPVFILKILHLPFPHKRVAFVIYATIFLSSFLTVFSIRPVLFAGLAVIAFVAYQAYMYSFEKVEHGYATFTYAAMIMPFLLTERENAKNSQQEYFRSWALRLIQILIASCYFLSGLEKLLISGIGWISPETFKVYLLLHQTKTGLYVAENSFLTHTLPVAALLFQLSFPLILFYPILKRVILPVGVVFHFSTVILFGISSFENPWVFAFIFFIDWKRVGSLIRPLPGYFKG